MQKSVVIGGGLVDGFTITGPFDNREQAIEWADREMGNLNWEVTTLEAPHDYTQVDGVYIMLIGCPTEGFSIVGPFDSPKSAMQWKQLRDAHSEGHSYWWTELETPEL